MIIMIMIPSNNSNIDNSQTRPSAFSGPCGQVLTVHGFVHKQGNSRKQFPLAYALMSHRRTQDYVAFFRTLKAAIEERELTLDVEAFMMDFESGKKILLLFILFLFYMFS